MPNEVLVHMEMANELLCTGNNRDAISGVEALLRLREERDYPLPPVSLQESGEWLGLFHLRRGEQEDCACRRR